MGPTGLGSPQDAAGMGCWQWGTRCGAAAFESFQLLTRAVTTERVIGTCCSGAAARVPPAQLSSPGACRCAGGGAGWLTGCCPIMGLFALLCHWLLGTGIAYGDTSRGRVLPPRCQKGVPLLAGTRSCCGEMGRGGRRADACPSVPQQGEARNKPGRWGMHRGPFLHRHAGVDAVPVLP